MWQEREKREETSSPETEKKTIFLRNGKAFFFSWLTRSLSLSLSHGGGGGLRTSLSLLPQAAAENDGLLRGTRKKKRLSLCFFLFLSSLSFSLSLASSFTTKKGACDACGPSFKVSTFSLSLVNGRCLRSLRRVKTCVCVCVWGGCLVAKRNETILYRGGRENELMKKKMKLF